MGRDLTVIRMEFLILKVLVIKTPFTVFANLMVECILNNVASMPYPHADNEGR